MIKIPFYEVGIYDVETNMVFYRVVSLKKAKKIFQKTRKSLLEDALHMLEYTKEEAKKLSKDRKLSKEERDFWKKRSITGDDMYLRIITNLLEEDYKKIDNGPFETPFIQKVFLEIF